jgi:hypothetical protein
VAAIIETLKGKTKNGTLKWRVGERAIRQAMSNCELINGNPMNKWASPDGKGWDTCFKVCIKTVIKNRQREEGEVNGQDDTKPSGNSGQSKYLDYSGLHIEQVEKTTCPIGG